MPATARWVREGILARYTLNARHNGDNNRAQSKVDATATIEGRTSSLINTSGEEK
jgi:hypothetical protein